MKSIRWEPSCSLRTDGRTDRQTNRQKDMAELIVALRSFTYEPKKGAQ